MYFFCIQIMDTEDIVCVYLISKNQGNKEKRLLSCDTHYHRRLCIQLKCITFQLHNNIACHFLELLHLGALYKYIT